MPLDKSIYAGVTYLWFDELHNEVKILLVHHKKVTAENGRDYPSYWCNPGGGIEDGETLLEGAEREFHEETANSLPKSQLEHPISYSISCHNHKKEFILVTTSEKPQELTSEDLDIDEVSFFTLSNLPNKDNNTFGDKIAFHHFGAILALLEKMQERLPLAQKKLIDELVDSVKKQEKLLGYN